MSRLDTTDVFLIAHPAHELAVSGWLQKNSAIIHVLTDGSGRNGTPRIDRTRRLVTELNCEIGEVFGITSDSSLYKAVLRKDLPFFNQLTNQIAESLVQQNARRVFGDAEQGLVMAHDLFRGIRIAAVNRAQQTLGRSIQQFDFGVDAPVQANEGAIEIALDQEELAVKLDRAYAYHEVRFFLDQIFKNYGRSFLEQEIFRFVDGVQPFDPIPTSPSQWEMHGIEMVREQICDQSISYRQHLLPIFHSLGVRDQVHDSDLCLPGRVAG